MSRTCEPFDLEQVYDEQINPLMAQIIEICKANKIPVLASFLFRYDPDDDGREDFCTTTISYPERFSPELIRADDIIRNGLPENRITALRITTEVKR